VLCNMNFELVQADPSLFLRYFLYLTCNSHDQMIIEASGFLLELVLVEIWPMGTRPSLLGAAALFGALWVMKDRLAASPVLTLMPEYFKISEEVLVNTSMKMLETLSNRYSSPYQGAQVKYASRSRHCSVAQHMRMQPDMVNSVLEHLRQISQESSSLHKNKMNGPLMTVLGRNNTVSKNKLKKKIPTVYKYSYHITEV
ncbi:unnamed protein product, partial [Meganyctiphanes norvegica]